MPIYRVAVEWHVIMTASIGVAASNPEEARQKVLEHLGREWEVGVQYADEVTHHQFPEPFPPREWPEGRDPDCGFRNVKVDVVVEEQLPHDEESATT
jgi:hypothetical protein